ncbi:type VI secretion protein IcmF [Photobacterium jeanii]|uniref:Type VI secretion protein IcmF n=1 Tax=Photobacterium jeanii TaxID=858640 RepID=A0A178K1S7_9GAMM|nr:type VI secretion system membrane subunit TssM [Photobacterium jeanii]OAN11057.1 type VI secretion protein IcmF [Photobacterium jeanii]PST90571.1 type VI secretion system membrane subunit TssM [Photobacterium jeanii]
MAFLKRVFGALIAFFRKKWVITLLGLIALSLLIWFGGPLVAIAGSEPLSSPVSRLVVLLVFAMLWGFYNIVHQAKSKKQNEQTVKTLLDGDDSQPADEASQQEIETLRSRIIQALDVLNETKGKRGRGIYQLPWYIMIGPPGTGKTTALQNSGLEFPLQESLGNDPLAGIGGTRYCDWWFTNKAVLIDTAGRYTTQDSNSEQDSRAWLGFLGLLKKHRTRRPINGAIITVSLANLLTQTRTERNLHARAIKQRILELKNQLGMQFPVYVILTKADLIAGFNEFFSDLDQEERDQIWGITFPESTPQSDKGVVSLFNKEFHHLLTGLLEKMNYRLSRERDIDKRTLIYEFPKQLRLLQAAADDFLKEIFAANAFEEPPMLRGVFVASATQEGVPIDRVMKETSGGLGLSQVPLRQAGGEAKGFFIKRLFEDVIIKEQFLGTVNRVHQKQNRWLHRGVVGTSCAAILIMGAIWGKSYQWNTYLVDESMNAIDQYHGVVGEQLTVESDVVSLVEGLNVLQALPAGFSKNMLDDDSIKHFGLYQGEKLGQPAVSAYYQALQGIFAQFLTTGLEKEMRQNEEYREYLYETLKTYLMLFMPQHYEATQVISWLESYFEREYPGEINETLRAALLVHSKNLQKAGVLNVAMNEDAVKAARKVLTAMPLSERAYQRLKLEFVESHVPSFRLTDVLGSQSLAIFERKSGKPLSMGIPGFYTYNGFHGVFQLESSRMVKRLMEDSWVYGDELKLNESSADHVVKDVRFKYYRDYIYEWTQLLNDLQLKKYQTADQGLSQAKILAGPERPVESLILAAQKELRLTHIQISEEAKAAGEVAAKAAGVAFYDQKQRLNRYLPSDIGKKQITLPGKEVEDAFGELLSVSENQLEAVHASFVQLNNYLAEMTSSGNNERIAYKSLLGETNNKTIGAAIKTARANLPYPFSNWLGKISTQTSKLAKKGSQLHVNDLWKSTVLKEYQTLIKGKYPFDPKSSRELPLRDFERFFGYGGTLDGFFNKYLEPFVDKSKNKWRFEKSIGLKEESLQVFVQAEAIRKAFFEAGTQNAKLKFGIKPLSLDQHIKRFKFEVGRQSLSYQHEPPRAKTLYWPDGGQTRVVFTPADAGHVVTESYGGTWGLFRLLDKSLKARPQSRKDNMLVIELKGNKAQLELIPNSAINPFWSRDMERFSCPTTL